MKVLVVVRTRDRNLLLKRSLNSISNQTYTDYVVTVVNDGGSRGELEDTIGKYDKSFKDKVSVINNKESLGKWHAANQGMKSQEADLVVLLDDDDAWHPDFLKVGVKEIVKNNYMAVVAECEKISETIDNNKIIETKREQFINYSTPLISLYETYRNNLIPTTTFLFRKSVFEKIGYYDETMPVLGDWEFNIRFLETYDIRVIKKTLGYVYHRDTVNTGPFSNTVIGGVDNHYVVRQELMNKKLRSDIANKSFGSGLLMNILNESFGVKNLANQMNEQFDVTIDNIKYILESVDQISHDINSHKDEINKINQLLSQSYSIKLANRIKKYRRHHE